MAQPPCPFCLCFTCPPPPHDLHPPLRHCSSLLPPPPPLNPRYVLGCSACDVGGLCGTFSVTVNILNVNEPPSAAPTRAFTIPENTPLASVLGTLTASDPDIGTVLSWSISVPGNAGTNFAVNSGGNVTVLLPLDFEAVQLFTFTATVSDGALSASTAVTVTITDVNEAPVMDSGIPYVGRASLPRPVLDAVTTAPA
jgi:hypothetical protein